MKGSLGDFRNKYEEVKEPFKPNNDNGTVVEDENEENSESSNEEESNEQESEKVKSVRIEGIKY